MKNNLIFPIRIGRAFQFILLFQTALSSSQLFAHEVSNPEAFVTHSLSVMGEVKQKLELKVGDLKKMPTQTLNDVPIISKKGTKVIKSIKGVLLKDILDKAEIVTKNPGDTKRMFIVATASDGYKAIFSWNEIFNSPLSEGILVAFEKDKKKLDDSDGELLLLSAKDFMTGARHVRWLKSVDVRKISD